MVEWHPVIRELYLSGPKQLFNYLDMDGSIEQFYYEYRYSKFEDGMCSVEINDVEATFNITSLDEFRIFSPEINNQGLMGETEVIADVLEELSSGDVFLDVGAHYGLYSCFVGSAEQNTDIIAVEPNTAVIQKLRENLESNGCEACIQEMALSDKKGTGHFEKLSDTKQSHLQLSDGGGDGISIPVISGDMLLESENVKTPTMIKIDIEGGEYSALQGLQQTLKEEKCRVVYVEVHPRKIPEYDPTEKKIEKFLENTMGHVEVVHQGVGDYTLKAVR